MFINAITYKTYLELKKSMTYYTNPFGETGVNDLNWRNQRKPKCENREFIQRWMKWPLLLKSTWSIQKAKDIRLRKANAINETCVCCVCLCVCVCVEESEKKLRLRKQPGGNKFIAVRRALLRENAEEEGVWQWMPREWEPQPLAESLRRETNTTKSGKAKSLLYLTCHGKVGYLCRSGYFAII